MGNKSNGAVKRKRAAGYIRVEAWTARFLGTRDRGKTLVELLETMDSGQWAPERWGEVEPIREPYVKGQMEQLLHLWTQDQPSGSGNAYNFLMFKRNKPKMLAMGHACRWGKPSLNSFWIELSDKPFLSNDGPERLKQILVNLVRWSQAEYGAVRYSREAHRRSAQMTPLERLEQAHWLNFFGPNYLKLFGYDRVTSVPCYRAEVLPELGMLLQATPRFDDPEITDLVDVLVAIEKHLGSQMFAGQGYPRVPCVVPDFDLSDTRPR